MNANHKTQCMRILQYCGLNGSITVREAFDKLEINSPTARISDLRKMGYTVEKIRVRTEESYYDRFFISKAVNDIAEVRQ